MNKGTLLKSLMAARQDIEPGQDIEIDLFRPSDALGISLAYLAIYGDSFPLNHVYDPEEVLRRNATDDQYTIVARTPKGEIVGLVGLFRHAPNPEVYEVGQLMILKSYRNSHIAVDITKKALGETPKRLGVQVLFGEAVCNHRVSQRLALQQGMVPTGLELECMPAGAYKNEGGVASNVSLALMFLVREKSVCSVCLPHEYAACIQSLYAGLGLVREYMQGRPLNGKTDNQDFVLADSKLVRLTVKQAGTDFIGIIEKAESTFGINGLMQVYLNLGDPGVAEAVTILRRRGYFFGGLLPCWFGSDGMIMQKVPRPPDWDALQLYGRKTKDILEYVRSDYMNQ